MKLCTFQQFFYSEQVLLVQDAVKTISFAEFWQDVANRVAYLNCQSQQHYALWTEDSYLFLVWLWAGLIAEKSIVLPPNRITQTEQAFAEKNIIFIDETYQVLSQSKPIDALVTNWETVLQQKLFFFTSGSTGQPQQIPRTLQQLLAEVRVLNQYFNLPESYCMLASVSHQHIYGLLFKLLLPLISGQAFYRWQLAYPEQILAVQDVLQQLKMQTCLVASPALLKRCVGTFDFAASKKIFCSGGKLDSGIRAFYPTTIVEVLGSSETGGIAMRTQDNAAWQTMSDVEIKIDQQHALWVKTAHAYRNDWIATGDLAQQFEQGFELLGRSDRLVKLEEKRLSLDEIEQTITQLPAVQQCHALLTQHAQRTLLSVVVVLSHAMREQLKQQGKKNIIDQLKKQLLGKLESIAMPRRWRFIAEIPRNAQDKINQIYMLDLFQPLFYPVILNRQQQQQNADYQLEFLPELTCFSGHFPGFPVYPGVGQIGFLVKFSQQLWIDLLFCTGYEQLKFQDLIRPYDVLQLHLQRQDHKILFQLDHLDGQRIASGRLLFQVKDLS